MEELRPFEDVLVAMRRIDEVVLRQVLPDETVPVAPAKFPESEDLRHS